MSERFPHDAAYKAFFSDPAMVESLLRDFVPEDFIQDLDFSTLERCFGSYVTDDLRERHDDIIWRISWKKDKWCYAVLIFEFQSSQDHWMALITKFSAHFCDITESYPQINIPSFSNVEVISKRF